MRNKIETIPTGIPYANKKVYELIQEETDGNVKAFAESINVSQQSLNRIFCIDRRNGKFPSVSNEIKQGIIEVYGKDEIWFIADRKDVRHDESKNIESNKNVVIPDLYYTYLVPMSAMAGTLVGFDADGVCPSECERIVSPIAGVDFAISVYGDSMVPEFPSGSRVLLKRINHTIYIEWGNVFVLDTTNGIILKEVQPSQKEGALTCHSLNPNGRYKDFDVPMCEVRAMYKVLACVSLR